MLLRSAAFFFFSLAALSVRGQEAVVGDLPIATGAVPDAKIASAWLDLRQATAPNTKPQNAPNWVEAVTLERAPKVLGTAARTTFRIRVARPRAEFQVLLFRLFFDDKAGQQPSVVAWDESGTEVLRSASLGNAIELPTSQTLLIPMPGVTTIDVEVPGDGGTIRGAYLDWMASTEVLHPVNVEHRDLIPEPFAAAAPLRAPARDVEAFGTVTATLAEEAIRIGASVETGAAFQFPLEAQPLVALISFEVASPYIDAPPEVYLNGESVGAAALSLPDLADPGFRGEAAPLVRQMRFQYTGWVRAQKLVPAASLRVGANDLLIIGGPGTPASAIRATQIQLKYLWDKSDYRLVPER